MAFIPRLSFARSWVASALLALVALPAVAQGTINFNNFGFESLERSLKLDPYQKQQFDLAVRATQKAVIAIGLGALQAKTRLAQELLKDKPDPDALFMAQDELVEFSKPYVSTAREEWLRFYATLDDQQVKTARAYVDEKLKLLEQVGAELGKFLAQKLQK